MKASLYPITQLGKGTLFIMPKPSSAYLAEDLLYYRSQNIDVVVSLLEEHETWQLQLETEATQTETAGLHFHQFPIPDRRTPSRALAQTIVSQITFYLDAGKSVTVHCRAGIGRSGLICSCVLKQYGWNADDAMALVSSARGVSVPDTEQQMDFICDF